ncbi:MAG TPA: M20/M25/M40 family metallo-hydrolase [Terriglobales bacterium]|nr:M20/M25/M40 family metallo-hydrolase [Terriglobales bacterium]
MDPIRFTRELIDIESITGNEAQVGDFLAERLARLGYVVQKGPVERHRFNVLALPPGVSSPTVVFSTHMDTVPPHIPSWEDDRRVYGRGACDAKGIIAAQTAAAQRLLTEHRVATGLLFVVGEERDSLGATIANEHPIGSKFLVNGEPTENRIALASKGALRVELIAHGKMAHSAYPELGDSAIDKLVEALHLLKKMHLPYNQEIGPATLNIGVIEGGRAPNVIADHAHAQILIRLVGPSEDIRRGIVDAVRDLVEVQFPLEIPFAKLRTVAGLPTMIAAFTTDIPKLSNWGEPMLIGPGSIHVAHTEHEFIDKEQLMHAVDIYTQVGKELSTH